MKIYQGVAGAALLGLAGVALAQVGGTPATGTGTPPGTMGSPAASVNGGVGVGASAAGDRARTERDAIGSVPSATTTTGTVTGTTPPIASTPGSSMGGLSGEATSGTAATKPGVPPR